ncbi:MAG: hypothetical protein AAF492_00365 [Verrucomicrobiota bacterium]
MRWQFPWAVVFGFAWSASSSLGDRAADAVAEVRELRCVVCHADDLNLDLNLAPAPDLKTAGQRLKPAWIRQFLRNPHGGRMPDMLSRLHVDERDQTIESIMHYLFSFKPSPRKKGRLGRAVSRERGRETFHRIGCVACHAEGLPDLKTKWHMLPLLAFLKDPLKTRPDGRMPHLLLADHEAEDLTAWLMEHPTSRLDGVKPAPAPASNPALAEKGRRAFQTFGCANCHDTGLKPTLAGPPLSAIRGREHCSAADYGDTPVPSRHLPEKLSPVQQVQSLVSGLQCNTCHTRSGTEDRMAEIKIHFTGDASLADAGRYPPTLNGAGGKLRSSWTEAIIGTTDNRLRGYLNTRMPVFGKTVARRMADALAAADARTEAELKSGPVDGRHLVGAGGKSCITCHDLGTWPSLGMRGMNLARLDRRLNPGWFQAYMLKPSAYNPGTLMPAFWPAGDSKNEISAIWTYLKDPSEQPEGYPPAAGTYEVVVGDTAVVMRTFMKSTGPFALAIGLPGGKNLVYDTQSCRFTEFWNGRFLDGYATWFSRFIPPETPLGTDHRVVKKDPLSLEIEDRRFEGYEVNRGRVRIRTRFDDARVTYDLFVLSDQLYIQVDGPESFLKQVLGQLETDRSWKMFQQPKPILLKEAW